MAESQEKMQENMGLIGKQFAVLDHGFVRVVDVMGNDAAIVQAARVSYGGGTKTVNEDKGLINYLMKHRHTSPFEMCEIKLHIKLPIFIARQWIRHRTANVNEISARYSILPEEFYVPDVENIAPQSLQNKQCRGGELSDSFKNDVQEVIQDSARKSYEIYTKLLGTSDEDGIAREIARGVLPLNMYTEWYWKIDLHNLLHFIKLRIHPHAQYEIRVYAEILAEIVKSWCPFAYNAFEEYVLGAETLSRSQIDIMKKIVDIDGLNGKDHNLSRRDLADLKKIFGLN